jgi:hypothetical protein
LLNPRINGDTAKPSHKDNKYCHKNINWSNDPNILQNHAYPVGLLISLLLKGGMFDTYAPHFFAIFFNFGKLKN